MLVILAVGDRKLGLPVFPYFSLIGFCFGQFHVNPNMKCLLCCKSRLLPSTDCDINIHKECSTKLDEICAGSRKKREKRSSMLGMLQPFVKDRKQTNPNPAASKYCAYCMYTASGTGITVFYCKANLF